MSELASLLLAVWEGDTDALAPLADWLEERGDCRAADVMELHVCHVKRLWLPAWDDYEELGSWNESLELAIRLNLRLLFPDVVLPIALLGWHGIRELTQFTQTFVVDEPSPAQAINAIHAGLAIPANLMGNPENSNYASSHVELGTTSARALPDGRWEVRREFIWQP